MGIEYVRFNVLDMIDVIRGMLSYTLFMRLLSKTEVLGLQSDSLHILARQFTL